jgi:hypothetical protein
MNVLVTGPNGGLIQTDLAFNISRAVKNFAYQLDIGRLKTNIHVKVHSKVFIDNDYTEGLCESIDERNFVIDIAMFSNWVVNLAHEMVHVKQFARGEMDAGLNRWKSNPYAGNIEYWDQPWEKEARRLQFKLAEEFSKA